MDSDFGEGLIDGFLMRFEETTGASKPAGMRMDSDSGEGFLEGFLIFSEVIAGITKPAGIKIDSDSGEGLMVGFLICSKEMPARMDFGWSRAWIVRLLRRYLHEVHGGTRSPQKSRRAAGPGICSWPYLHLSCPNCQCIAAPPSRNRHSTELA